MSSWKLQVCLLMMGMMAGAAVGAEEITPAEWLKQQPAPVFRDGHTLPPLTRFGWTLPFDARVELTERWGYALEFGGYATDKVVEKALTDPNSVEGQVIALTEKNPKKYPLCIILSRELPKDPPAETWVRDAEGNLIDGKKIWSPEAPQQVSDAAAELRAGPLRKLRERVPVAMILNGGEYALGVPGFIAKICEKDPRVMAAKGDKGWFEYISEKKAAMEITIAEAVRKAAPDRTFYIYYTAGGGTHRNRYSGWSQWAYGFEWMRPASDLPTNEYYYKHFNDGWVGGNDMLTQALNSRGHELKYGCKQSYDWLCAGWTDESKQPAQPAEHNPAALVDPNAGKLGRIDMYTGFLKCLYTAGTVGGNAGYYAYPKGGFGVKYPADQPPHWIQQMVALSNVHAMFSHLEPFVKDSDLLPGPDKHRWSKDQPAYEFPSEKGVRVVARKHVKEIEWLITAWAADGKDREVKVTIPELGEVVVVARGCGSVYRATLKDGKPQLALTDKDGLHPTQEMKPTE